MNLLSAHKMPALIFILTKGEITYPVFYYF